MIYRFDVTLHAAPSSAVRGEPRKQGPMCVTPLIVPPQSLQMPLTVTFEKAAEKLAALPQLFFEPDGSFVWVSSGAGNKWQVDGNLFDMGPRLMYATLKGSCPQQNFDRLLSAFGWPECDLVFQTTNPSLLLDEADFRRLATVGEKSAGR